jgi:hypothetical protein
MFYFLAAYTGREDAARMRLLGGVHGGGCRSSSGWQHEYLTDERAAVMTPNYGYQLYQAERIQTRAEMLASDARRGRRAASRRGRRSPASHGRGPARQGRGRGIMVIIAGRTARAA